MAPSHVVRTSFLLCLFLGAGGPFAQEAVREESTPTGPRTIHVRQSEPADLVGDDDRVLKQACDQLRRSGGTIVVGPGRYTIRRSIPLPANLVLRGEPGAVLAVPAPVLTTAASPAGSSMLALPEGHGLAAEVIVQILPPLGQETFPDGVTPFLDLQFTTAVEDTSVTLKAPLTVEVPAGSRVGLPLKVFQTNKLGHTTIENLAFEGGRTESIPMPGHSQRCAIWAASPYGFGEETLEPPAPELVIRHCRFSDWYGRAIALYNQTEGLIEGCFFERIHDEAIDLDHYVDHYRVVGNVVRDSVFGIVLNDASRSVVEYNTIEGVEIGINCWALPDVIAKGWNEDNVIRHNVVLNARDTAIRVAEKCVRFTIEHNWHQGPLTVVEPSCVVQDNSPLER